MAGRWYSAGVVVATVCLVAAVAARADDTRPIDEDRIREAAAELPQLRSMLVSYRGETLVEHYAPGVSATRPANIKSASKSVIAALVGIAIEQGLIEDVQVSLGTFFPDLARAEDPRKASITMANLLTMQTGLQSTSGANYGSWVRSRNWVRYALDRPLVSAPGTTMEYSTGTSHLISAILTRVSGRSTWQYAQDTLGRALGFTLARWPRDPQGIYFGGNEMLMTPRQMLAFGELYRNRGRVGDRQVVPAAWVDASCQPRTRSRYDTSRLYGYGWWIQDIGGEQACFAWGYGGQYIMIFPNLEVVVAVTSSTAVSDERRGHRRGLFELIAAHVVQPLRRTTTAG
jgi:CubicO group peptidase (beta-lactamase class C family)